MMTIVTHLNWDQMELAILEDIISLIILKLLKLAILILKVDHIIWTFSISTRIIIISEGYSKTSIDDNTIITTYPTWGPGYSISFDIIFKSLKVGGNGWAWILLFL